MFTIRHGSLSGAKHDPLLSNIQKDTLSNEVRGAILKCFWQIRKENSSETFNAYFWSVVWRTLYRPFFTDQNSKSYFQRCCSEFCATLDLSLSQVLDFVGYLQENMDVTRRHFFDNFDWTSKATRGWYAGLHIKNGVRPEAYLVLDFCVLVWLMIDVKHQYIAEIGDRRSDIWPEDLSLSEFLTSKAFPKKPASMHETTRWPKSLSALNLHRIGQFDIIWTDNILDHLVIDTQEPQIRMYHHINVLLALQNSTIREAFPQGSLEETVQTLALLLPKYNQSSLRWFLGQHKQARKIGSYLDLDARIQSLQLHSRESSWYQYWGERLSLIQSAFDQTEPNSFTQWWYDTRHAERRTTFWIGMSGIFLAVLLGLIQSVAGIWQVVLAYKK